MNENSSDVTVVNWSSEIFDVDKGSSEVLDGEAITASSLFLLRVPTSLAFASPVGASF